MVQVKFCLLIAALCACCGLGSSNPGLKEKPDTIIIPISASSNPEHNISLQEPAPASPDNNLPVNNTSSSTTDSPTTNSPTTDTPTTKPTTDTPTTKPTTTSSTTTAPTTTSTSSTTQKPTPIPPPAPTPAPGPLPAPEQGTWPWSENNVTCIVLQFAAQLNITYTKNVNDGTALGYLILNVPSNATVMGGACAATEQIIKLSWLPAVESNYTNTMTFTYSKNDTTKIYGLKSLELELSQDQFVNATSNSMVVLKHGSAWPTPVSTSYRCTPATRFNLTGDAASGSAAALTFTKLQEEAFRTSNTTAFSAARECGGDVPDAVPIAVGCALGGLVLVVLVAYLVGRRRSNARGYLSM